MPALDAAVWRAVNSELLNPAFASKATGWPAYRVIFTRASGRRFDSQIALIVLCHCVSVLWGGRIRLRRLVASRRCWRVARRPAANGPIGQQVER